MDAHHSFAASTAEEREQTERATRLAIAVMTQALARGDIDEAAWQRFVTDSLAEAYLMDDDPRWQSGFNGDATLWRQARELVLDAVDRDGSFLDVGCATGHLLQCLSRWSHERGRRLDLFGLELNTALADAARHRLPDLASAIFTGNVVDWTSEPPRQFTFIRTGLEYVSPGRGPFLILRLLRDLVEPGGRLIVGPVNEGELEATRGAFVTAGCGPRSESHAKDRLGKTRHIVWVERPLTQ